MTESISLNVIGILCGTDKSSVLQDYLRHYERIFADLRDEPINVIEIGVDQGASLAMLSRWVTQAVIVGVDNNPETSRYDTARTPVRIGSQDDAEFLRAVADEFPPRIVIDDGSHRADHNRITLEVMFPLVLPGGLYVIEDLYVHSGAPAEYFRGTANGPPTDFINDLSSKIILKDSGIGDSALNVLADQIERNGDPPWCDCPVQANRAGIGLGRVMGSRD